MDIINGNYGKLLGMCIINKAYSEKIITCKRINPLIFIREGTPDKKWAMVVAVILISVLI